MGEDVPTPASTVARPSVDGRSPAGAFIALEVGERGRSAGPATCTRGATRYVRSQLALAYHEIMGFEPSRSSVALASAYLVRNSAWERILVSRESLMRGGGIMFDDTIERRGGRE